MYGYAMMMKLEFSLLMFMMITMFLMCPGASCTIWLSIKRKLAVHKLRMLNKKQSRREDKLKKYWEIDLRKLR